MNAYFGQAGAYILTDPAEAPLGLPSTYGVDDIPLVLSSKIYNQDGTLFSPAGETDSLWGDVIHVNGQPWPYMKVEPRKYRFRLLNSAVSRTFRLYFERQAAAGNRIPFQVIASDAGLLTGPVKTSDIYISMAERWEVIFDFSSFAGQNITLRHTPDTGTDEDYINTDKVMRFVVSSPPVVDNTRVPSALRTVPFPTHGSGIDQHFLFEHSGGRWLINDVGFSDVKNRILARPPRGSIQIWELQNGGGGWSHPIHIHLVDFRVLSREGGDRKVVLPYEAAGLKDVVWLGPGETVKVEAHFAPWDGVYMFHCHNLIHEDHEMMAAFNVTALADLGYAETSFIDPMEARWRARPVVAADFTAGAITERVQFMASLQPYSNVDAVLQKLDQYWDSHGGA